MLKNYLIIASRNIRRYKYLSALNVIGLVVALTGALVIVQFMSAELQYDQFHVKKDRIFRAYLENHSNNGVSTSSNLLTGLPSLLKDQNPEIESYSRVSLENDYLDANEKLIETNYIYADGFLFDIFDFNILEGDPSALNDKADIIFISENLAEKFFDEESGLGELIRIKKKDYLVKGIIRDIPLNSHLQFDAVIPFNSLPSVYHQFPNSQTSSRCYFLLQEPSQREKIAAAINQILDFNDYGILKPGESFGAEVKLQQLKDIHLDSFHFIRSEQEQAGSRTLFNFLGVSAIIIVLMAWFNYVNLSLANTLKRGKEVGIKRVIGARRSQVIAQFMVESVLLMSITLLLAVTLGQFLTPMVTRIFDIELVSAIDQPNLLEEWPFLALLIFVAAVTLISGIYVGWVITSFKAISVLKGTVGHVAKGISFKKGLVVIQFVIAIVAIVSTHLIQSQLQYVLGKDLGVNVEDVVVFRYDRKIEKRVNPLLFKDKLQQYPQISNVAVSGMVPGMTGNTSRGGVGVAMTKDANGNKVLSRPVQSSKIDDKYIQFYGIELIAGENFASGSNNSNKVLINEQYAQTLGYEDPEEAINKTVGRNKIIGVVNNYHSQSLKKEFIDMQLGYERSGRWATYSIRLNKEQQLTLLPQIEQDWKAIFETDIFEYTILKDHIDNQYLSDTRFSYLIAFLASIVLVITTLGLIGITHLSVIHSLKEIGIRKILGATKWNVIGIFAKGYVIMLLLAMAMGGPFAAHLFGRWLQDFIFRVNVTGSMYALPIGIMVLISILILSIQGLRSFKVRPIDSLRIE